MPDFSTVLTDLDGHPIKDVAADASGNSMPVDMTLGRCAANALLAAMPDEQGKVPGADHLKRFVLAIKVRGAGSLDLSAEDTAFLKDRIAKAYGSSLLIGRAWTLLDPACAG